MKKFFKEVKLYIKFKIKQLVNSRFTLGLVCFLIGASYIFVYLEVKPIIEEMNAGTTTRIVFDTASGSVVKAVEHQAIEQTEPKNSISGEKDKTPSSQIIAQIKKVAEEENFKEVDNLLRLAKCESGFRQYAFNTTNQSNDRGIFQISKRWHPTVTDDQAYDPIYATRWTINKIKAGGLKLWMCSNVWDDESYLIN